MTSLSTPPGSVTRWSARAQLAALQTGALSAQELLACTVREHRQQHPRINAVVTTDFDAAEQAARASDERRARGLPPRALEGLPVAVKDLEDTAGMRTTSGSLLRAHRVPESDSLVVQRLRAAGAIITGKTNTPEFGTGSHTYNRVFGTTRNPYDPSRSAGGSSGGAAAALAAGLSSVADGSDMGGSLRNPAAFCNVVGLRPTLGRVPNRPTGHSWGTLATNGPMARTVADTALLLSVLSGADHESPLAAAPRLDSSLPELRGPLRIGWSRSLGGLDVEQGVTEVLERDGRVTLSKLGHRLSDVEPELEEADHAFRVLRGLMFARNYGPLLAQHCDQLSPELAANTLFGQGLTTQDLFTALDQRERVFRGMNTLFCSIDVLAAPATQVLPFPAEQHWPTHINGVPQRDYLDWMRVSWRVSLTGFTALSVPCGFSAEGLPVGLQLIAPPGKESRILALAAQFERERPVWSTAPPAHSPQGLTPVPSPAF